MEALRLAFSGTFLGAFTSSIDGFSRVLRLKLPDEAEVDLGVPTTLRRRGRSSPVAASVLQRPAWSFIILDSERRQM